MMAIAMNSARTEMSSRLPRLISEARPIFVTQRSIVRMYLLNEL